MPLAAAALVLALAGAAAPRAGGAEPSAVALAPAWFFAAEPRIERVASVARWLDDAPNGSLSLLEFFAPWCGHCQRFKKEWLALTARLAREAPTVRVGAVDCAADEAECARQAVRGYPSVRLFGGGGAPALNYSGPFRAGAVRDWVLRSAAAHALGAAPAAPRLTVTRLGALARAHGPRVLLVVRAGNAQPQPALALAVGQLMVRWANRTELVAWPGASGDGAGSEQQAAEEAALAAFLGAAARSAPEPLAWLVSLRGAGGAARPAAPGGAPDVGAELRVARLSAALLLPAPGEVRALLGVQTAAAHWAAIAAARERAEALAAAELQLAAMLPAESHAPQSPEPPEPQPPAGASGGSERAAPRRAPVSRAELRLSAHAWLREGPAAGREAIGGAQLQALAVVLRALSAAVPPLLGAEEGAALLRGLGQAAAAGDGSLPSAVWHALLDAANVPPRAQLMGRIAGGSGSAGECGGSPSQYTCGLWLLLHALAVRTADEASALLAGQAILCLVREAFGCAHCAAHFLEMGADLPERLRALAEGPTRGARRELALWLWRAHNNVNKRLADDAAREEAGPARTPQRPLAAECGACRGALGRWDEGEVLRWLRARFCAGGDDMREEAGCARGRGRAPAARGAGARRAVRRALARRPPRGRRAPPRAPALPRALPRRARGRQSAGSWCLGGLISSVVARFVVVMMKHSLEVYVILR